MNLPININDLLTARTVEWERLEFKAGWNPEKILRTLCAFANDFHNLGGGYIIIGVGEENGRPVLPPVGLPASQLDTIQKEIIELGYRMVPYYHPIIAPCEIDGKHLLVLWAMGGQTRPYKAPASLAKGEREFAYYIRKGSATVRAKGGDETELVTLAATVPFDDRMNQQARVEDLSRDLIQEYLQQVNSDLAGQADGLSLLELGRQMQIVGGVQEAPFPLNVGLMMFNPEPHRFFPFMQIDVVWFPREGPGGDKFSEKIFKGSIPRMIRDALDYIRRNFISETVIKHPDRAESDRVQNFPYSAVEEAVVNAVYHRGYDVREPVEVRIEYEELVVLSYPGPDRSVRLEHLRAGRPRPRRYRNRRIGEFLKELEFTEGRCTGIPKILEAMRKNGSPPAEFDFDDDHSYFMVRLPVHPASLGVAKSIAGSETELVPAGIKSGPSRDQVAGQVEAQEAQVEAQVELVEWEISLLRECAQKDATGKELLNAAGYSNRTGNFKRGMEKLIHMKLIAMTIPDKPKSSKQRYRLTSKGRAVLDEVEKEGRRA